MKQHRSNSKSRVWAPALAAGLMIATHAPSSQAVNCSSTKTSKCWVDYTTHNYGQVSIGHLNRTDGSTQVGRGMGLVCGVNVANASSWGNWLDCFVASGATGHRTVALVRNAPAITTANPIVSLAIEGAGVGYWIHVLQKDNIVRSAWLPVPFPADQGGNPELTSWGTYVFPQLNGSPSTAIIPRQIEWVDGVGLVALATNNRLYTPVAEQWNTVWKPLSTTFYPAGTNVALLGQDGVGLKGTTGTSRDVGPPLLWGNPVSQSGPPDLPVSLPQGASDPNLSFSMYGRQTPLVCEWTSCYVALSKPGSPLGTFTPNIMRSSLTFGQWSAWQAYTTGTEVNMSQSGGVWSLRSAQVFRNLPGSLFAIGGSVHLFEWIP